VGILPFWSDFLDQADEFPSFLVAGCTWWKVVVFCQRYVVYSSVGFAGHAAIVARNGGFPTCEFLADTHSGTHSDMRGMMLICLFLPTRFGLQRSQVGHSRVMKGCFTQNSRLLNGADSAKMFRQRK
jgi:hypothetical protein